MTSIVFISTIQVFLKAMVATGGNVHVSGGVVQTPLPALSQEAGSVMSVTWGKISASIKTSSISTNTGSGVRLT